jgi:alpha-ketoglutarate-dependent taurine dioxygenase
MKSDLITKPFFLSEEHQYPLVMTPKNASMDIADWCVDNKDQLLEKLTKHGALLFRGFDFNNIDVLEKTVHTILGELVNYIDRNSMRSAIKGNIFTASDAKGELNIPLHCESSFTNNWPSRIFFFCHKPSEIGGEMPLANVNRVFSRLSPDITNVFLRKKVMYIRNFVDENIWKYVFQVNSKDELDTFSKQNNIKIEWLNEKKFRATQVRPAILKHPVTKENIWFNQVENFYTKKRVIDRLNPFYSGKKLWRSSYFGDGADIPAAVIEKIRDAYDKETLLLKWEKNDLLILDNMKIAHGRRPFQGEREIWTGMSQMTSWNSVN